MFSEFYFFKDTGTQYQTFPVALFIQPNCSCSFVSNESSLVSRGPPLSCSFKTEKSIYKKGPRGVQSYPACLKIVRHTLFIWVMSTIDPIVSKSQLIHPQVTPQILLKLHTCILVIIIQTYAGKQNIILRVQLQNFCV